MRRCSDFGRVLELVTEPPALAGVGVPLLLPARKEASASLWARLDFISNLQFGMYKKYHSLVTPARLKKILLLPTLSGNYRESLGSL